MRPLLFFTFEAFLFPNVIHLSLQFIYFFTFTSSPRIFKFFKIKKYIFFEKKWEVKEKMPHVIESKKINEYQGTAIS